MPEKPFYYRLGGGDLDRLFEQAYGRWTPLPLQDMGIPAEVLADDQARIDLRDRLHSAAHYRLYSLRVHFIRSGGIVSEVHVFTAHSKYRKHPPRHLTG